MAAARHMSARRMAVRAARNSRAAAGMAEAVNISSAALNIIKWWRHVNAAHGMSRAMLHLIPHHSHHLYLMPARRASPRRPRGGTRQHRLYRRDRASHQSHGAHLLRARWRLHWRIVHNAAAARAARGVSAPWRNGLAPLPSCARRSWHAHRNKQNAVGGEMARKKNHSISETKWKINQIRLFIVRRRICHHGAHLRIRGILMPLCASSWHSRNAMAISCIANIASSTSRASRGCRSLLPQNLCSTAQASFTICTAFVPLKSEKQCTRALAALSHNGARTCVVS